MDFKIINKYNTQTKDIQIMSSVASSVAPKKIVKKSIKKEVEKLETDESDYENANEGPDDGSSNDEDSKISSMNNSSNDDNNTVNTKETTLSKAVIQKMKATKERLIKSSGKNEPTATELIDAVTKSDTTKKTKEVFEPNENTLFYDKNEKMNGLTKTNLIAIYSHLTNGNHKISPSIKVDEMKEQIVYYTSVLNDLNELTVKSTPTQAPAPAKKATAKKATA